MSGEGAGGRGIAGGAGRGAAAERRARRGGGGAARRRSGQVCGASQVRAVGASGSWRGAGGRGAEQVERVLLRGG